jgi:hypothetical protein
MLWLLHLLFKLWKEHKRRFMTMIMIQDKIMIGQNQMLWHVLEKCVFLMVERMILHFVIVLLDC